jgi:hypothetical protein
LSPPGVCFYKALAVFSEAFKPFLAIMLPEYQEYYHQLLAAIESHKGSGSPEMEQVEACFKSSLEHWGKVHRQVRQEGFATPEEEIHFFKVIKPLFASRIEYYTWCYHTLLFMPSNDIPELRRFWKWELRKIQRFYENNREFCAYIREGATDKDAEYFVRSANPVPRTKLPLGLIHDLDAETSTSHDHLVTLISAYNLYEIHILAEIEKLGGYIFFSK